MAVFNAGCSARHVLRSCKFIYSSSLIPSFNVFYRSPYTFGVRFLYSDEYLGIDKYVDQRKRILGQFGNLKEKFCSRMEEFLEKKDQITVFTEDLKNMVFMIEDKEREIDICIRMMHQFNQQNKELRFGSFVFGPVVMRMLYHLDKPDIALQLLMDEKLEGFFYQLASFHVAMDLLFKHKRYQEILSLYELLSSKNLHGSRFPGSCVILATAACYMLNTKESCEYAKQIATAAGEAGATIPRRAITYISHLALKQNDPKTAMEILAAAPQFSYVTIRNLRIMALAEMDRLEDIFPVLRSIINSDVPTHGKTSKEICLETLEYIQRSVDRVGDKDYARIYEQIKRGLKENQHLNETSIEDLLLSTIVVKPISNDKSWSSYLATGMSSSSSSAFRRGRENQKTTQTPLFKSRPGLRDIDE